jgi:hypothetical protein
VRGRALLIGTAIISSILGAIVVYLVLTVPNDLEAGALMRQAKKDIDAHQTERAREKLSRIVQQYPRTDAAAAATVALITLGDAERARLASELAAMKRDFASQKQALGAVSEKVGAIAAAPPPAPAPVVVSKPAPAPKKKAAVHSKPRRRRR